MTDPRIDLLGAIAEIQHTQAALEETMKNLYAYITLQTMTVSEIAQKLDVSIATLNRKPWNLPNYGRSNVGEQTRRWLVKTVSDWFSIPEDERRRKWEEMSSSEKRRMLGVSA